MLEDHPKGIESIAIYENFYNIYDKLHTFIFRNCFLGQQGGFSLVLNISSPTRGYLKLPVPVTLDGSDTCLRHSSGRGIGKLPSVMCHDDENKYGAFCYPKCRDGYESFGCCVCHQQCPSNFHDDGAATCIKPEAYGRGAGYPWKFGDGLDSNEMFRRCEADHGTGNCEKYGAIVYPKCRSGFHPIGCCVCTPRCPDGMHDIAISCEKDSYGRGAGVFRPTCSDDQEEDAGLCYKKCPDGFHGVGTVCWQNCPSSIPYKCGVMCTEDTSTCLRKVASIVKSALEVGGDIFIGVAAANILAIIEAAFKVADIVADVKSNPYC